MEILRRILVLHVVDPTKTICATYSQDRVDVFGPSAGNHCVAMSLFFLIYNYSHDSITTSEDLIQIINIDNELNLLNEAEKNCFCTVQKRIAAS